MKDKRDRMFPGMVLKIVVHLSRNRENIYLDKLGIYPGQTRTLLHLRHNNGCNQKDIANAANVSSATMTKSIKRLQSQGLVKKVPDENDMRSFKIYMTEKCEKLLDEAVDIHTKVYMDALEGFSDDERMQLESYLRRMEDNLEAMKASGDE